MPTLKKTAFLAAAIMFIFSPKFGLSQSTATVTDSDSISWVGGTYQITLVPVPPNVTPYRSDTGQNITTSFSGTLDGSGSFSVTLTPISVILPKGLTWQFTVCPNVLAGSCGTVNIPVNGSGSVSSQINAVITAPRISGGRGSYAYADVEVAAVANNSYYNVTSATLRCYGSSWGACGSGAGGISGLTANYIPKAGSGTTITANSAIDDGVTTVGTITSTEPVVAPSFTASGTASGYAGLTAGSSVTAAPTSTVLITVPTSVTAYGLELPGAQPTSGNTAMSCTAANPSVCTWVVPGGAPTGAASNCLTGTYPGPGLSSTCVVAGIAGQAIAPSAVGGAKQFSVTNSGALCNGSADDSTPIQAAINAAATAGGGIVILPNATCNFGTKLTRPRTVKIQGQGRTVSLLSYTGTGVAMVTGDAASSAPTGTTFKGGLADFTLTASTYNSGSLGIFLGGDPAGVISPTGWTDDNEKWERIGISNFGIGSEMGNNSYLFNAIDVIWGGNGQHWKDPGNQSNSGERMVFTNSVFGGSVGTSAPAIELDYGGSDYFFYGNSFDYNVGTTPDIGCQSGVLRAHFYGNHFEKFTGEFLRVGAGCAFGEIEIYGGTFLNTTGTAADYISLQSGNSQQDFLAVYGSQVVDFGTLTYFIDVPSTFRTVTLNAVVNQVNANTMVNNHGIPGSITITNTYNQASVVGDTTQFNADLLAGVGNYIVSSNPTYFGAYGVFNGGSPAKYIGAQGSCAPGTQWLGFCGYYQGLGMIGATFSAGQPLLSVFNSNDAGGAFGIGHSTLLLDDNRGVFTYNNTLDNGSGEADIVNLGGTAPGIGRFTTLTAPIFKSNGSAPTYTPGTGIASVVCASGHTCTQSRGELTVTNTSATTGTIVTLNFATSLASVPECWVIQNGGVGAYALGHGTPTTGGFTISAGLTLLGVSTVTVDYGCQL